MPRLSTIVDDHGIILVSFVSKALVQTRPHWAMMDGCHNSTVEELFKGRHFDQEIVVLCVRWYLSLSSVIETWSS